jgi:threonine dehydratase
MRMLREQLQAAQGDSAPVRTQVVVEPSGAVGLAAVLSAGWAASPAAAGVKRVGVILCGANVSPEQASVLYAPDFKAQ